MAVRDSKLAFLNKAAFHWLHSHSRGFCHFLIRQLNERVGQLTAGMESERLLDPSARLAQTLFWLFNPTLSPAGDRHIEINQEELALLAGVSRSAINNAIERLSGSVSETC